MITILTETNIDQIMDYIQGLSVRPDEKQCLVPGVFSNPLILRNLIFNSQMIVVANLENNSIEKLFAILFPSNDTEEACCTVVALYFDMTFIQNAIRILQDITEGCKKFKFIVNTKFVNHSLCKIISDSGFKYELSIPIQGGLLEYYSYFLK